jgi:hypothetical protein
LILRRFSQSLGEQNWTAIAIEFVLLVLGVFLGIQVANWNEDRRDHDRERAYLLRISAELDESVASIETSNELTKQRMTMNQLVIDSMLDPALVQADPGRFIRAVKQGNYTFAPKVNGHTFEEIKSNGELGIFSDPKLSLDLMAFYSDMQSRAQWNELRALHQHEYATRGAGILSPIQMAIEPDAAGDIRSDDVDGAMAAHQRMLARAEFLDWVPVTLQNRRTDLRYGHDILKAAQELRDRVRVQLGQPPLLRAPTAAAAAREEQK